MFKLFLILISIISVGLSQVAPSYQPYSLIKSEFELPITQLAIDNEINLDFTETALMTIAPDGFIYRLSLSFNNITSGHLEITNWQVPDGSMLFIFNDEKSYTGPYLSNNEKEFTSGRFISNKLTLEYFEPIHAIFAGRFNIKGILPDFVISSQDTQIHNVKVNLTRERPKIMVTGYWPPTNEMVRHFSQNSDLNPEGWQGENWENLGYDVVSFFPEFDPANCNNCGQGYGNLEVDYQDFSGDFWPIVQSVKPVAIITFSRGYNDHSWELENRVVNRTNWVQDYTAPLLPTPNPPDDSVPNYHVRYTSLPVDAIISEIERAGLGLDAYLDNTNAGMFLSEFAGYHGTWYKEDHDENPDFPCFAGGHIHVGAQIDWATAKQAAEISIRTLIEYVDQFMVIPGDCNSDGAVNILDVVALANVILGTAEFTPSQIIAADLDGNDVLNILDIIAIVNLILT
ncbi:MAG: dockerin type I domain-containing protein [Candidatus Marinimicrobia bacterium]|nr:dockerin type I domain-containing protein [Candidatus Neomarinimicrobiota bacterium]